MAQQLLAQAKADGVELADRTDYSNQLTANVLGTALEAEIEEPLGYENTRSKGEM